MRAFREHLATEPDDGEAHALLALALCDMNKAREADPESLEALRHAPDLEVSHVARSAVLNRLGRNDEALRHANQVVELNASSVLGRQMIATVRFDQRRWGEALAATNEGLAIDPEDADLQSLRARILTQMGRHGEAAAAIEGTLRLAPESSYAHVAQGMAHLHRGAHTDAMESFREALRLDPTNATARAGMVEAMKGRNPVYGAMLRWFLWTSRLGGRATFVLIVGYIALQRVSGMLARNPETALLGTILLYGLVLFAWMTFAASPLFNTVLLLDPVGRHALTAEERYESKLVGVMVGVGLVALLLSFTVAGAMAQLVAITALGAVIPLHISFGVRGPLQQGIPVAITILMAMLGTYGVILLAQGNDQGLVVRFWVIALAVLSSWLAIPLAARSRRA